MRVVLVVNMGAPSSPGQMKTFLRHMFRDRRIIPLPAILRYLVAELITRLRYRKSWRKYELIGGSPLKQTCVAVVHELQKRVDVGCKVALAYSYAEPFISQTINKLINEGASRIDIVTMYPQSSFSTTKSVEDTVAKVMEKYRGVSINVLPEYYSSSVFVAFWVKRIRETMIREGMNAPTLVFSAHSVPRVQISGGDTYEFAIYESARLIASELSLPCAVGFQSRVGRMEWVGPEVKTAVSNLIDNGVSDMLVVPVSFLTENLETLYDIDRELIPRFEGVNIRKVPLVNCEADLAELFDTVLRRSKTGE